MTEEFENKLRYLGIVDDTGTRKGNVGTSDYSEYIIQPWPI